MLTLGPLTFAQPWLLGSLALLPVIWLMLRVLPPAPRRVLFPAVRLLADLGIRDQVSTRTPPWIVAVRLLAATLTILALAHPLYKTAYPLAGSGPLILVVDDDWMAAPSWRDRVQKMSQMVDEAERSVRPVIVLLTTPADPSRPGHLSAPIGPLPAAEARRVIRGIFPKPWRADHAAARMALDQLARFQRSDIVWLSDGFDHGEANRLATRLQQLGSLHIITDAPDRRPYALLPLEDDPTGIVATVKRMESAVVTDKTAMVIVRALGKSGQVLARNRANFDSGRRTAEVLIALPPEVRNRVTRVEIEGADSAGGVILLDERWHRAPIGLVAQGLNENQEPLLSDLHYLEKALAPLGDVRKGTIDNLLSRNLGVMVLPDVGRLIGSEFDQLNGWLERGGVVIRFAGPNLSAASTGMVSPDGSDSLLPVPLRAGGRALGGALTWEQPASLADFPEGSPFQGLVPPPEVKVSRQVLAEPAYDLKDRTWARLVDGTPLVTAVRRGKGWLVLFHTTAGPAWTSLPLSGLFAEMLGRIAALGRGFAGATPNRLLQPIANLNGFGELGPPDASAVPLRAEEARKIEAGPRHPPGLYGSGGYKFALNVTMKNEEMRPLIDMPAGTIWSRYGEISETDLKPWLLALALLFVVLDTAVTLGLKGLLHFPSLAKGRTMSWVLLGAAAATFVQPNKVWAADEDDEFALQATLHTRLAYVVTGDPDLDRMSRAGLSGLTRVLVARTSVEAAEPMGVDLERHELAFFPLLYWPMTEAQKNLSFGALSKIDSYMKNGGTILFDTRDQRGVTTGLAAGPGGSGADILRRVLGRLDTPALVPIDSGHVLNRSFYLISSSPGRWTGGNLWIEKNTGRANLRVASILVGGNDWAAAWALDEENRPLVAIVPNSPGQRELSFRFGINLVMYTLTGNYKDDQVHLPALIERLGQ